MNEQLKKPEEILPGVETCRLLLETEIGHWREAGQKIRLFLRDDDAIDDTPALDRLVSICEAANIPLLLAIIPDPAREALAKRIENVELVTPAVHGFAHVNHASKNSPHGRKSCELGNHRPLETVMKELKQGQKKLHGWFGKRLSPILVPPWNRISDEVRSRVDHLDFKAVSAHGWDTQDKHLPSVNVHLDIFHWSGGRIGRKFDWIWYNLAKNLKTARELGFMPVGILTHHLVHDDQAWEVIEALASDPVLNEQAEWMKADKLIGAFSRSSRPAVS